MPPGRRGTPDTVELELQRVVEGILALYREKDDHLADGVDTQRTSRVLLEQGPPKMRLPRPQKKRMRLPGPQKKMMQLPGPPKKMMQPRSPGSCRRS